MRAERPCRFESGLDELIFDYVSPICGSALTRTKLVLRREGSDLLYAHSFPVYPTK
jgi:hypothetical protein